jgi:hypothetical protein
MKNSFWGLIGSSFQEIQTFWYGFLGFVIAIVLAAVAGTTPIALFWVLGIIAAFLLIVATLFRAYYQLYKKYQKIEQSITSRILRVRKDSNTGAISYLLLRDSELFANDSMISFIYTDEYDNEAIIATGFIITRQSNGLMQAEIYQSIPTYQYILDKVAEENKTVLERIIVKPGIPKNMF